VARGAGPGRVRGSEGGSGSSMRRVLRDMVAWRRRMWCAKGKWLPKTAGGKSRSRRGGAANGGTGPRWTSRALVVLGGGGGSRSSSSMRRALWVLISRGQAEGGGGGPVKGLYLYANIV
jgi:hypothetical protein